MTRVLLIYNARLLDEAADSPGALLVIEGKIRAVFHGYFTNAKTAAALASSVLKEDGYGSGCAPEMFDAKGLTVTPAFIDMHVHLRYPGQTQKEDLDSGLHAAAAGGYGTVVAMPNTSPVVSSAEMAAQIEAEGAKIGLSNLIQAVSITNGFSGGDTSHLDAAGEAGVRLITEDGHDVASAAVLLDAMTRAAEHGMIVSCHSEDAALAAAAAPFRRQALELMRQCNLSAWGTDITDGAEDDAGDEALDKINLLFTRANEILALAENIATVRNIAVARQAGCHIHIAHVSTAQAMDAVRAAKEGISDEDFDLASDEADAAYEADLDGTKFIPSEKQGKRFAVTCEVTPHHLALCGTDEPYVRALVNPPLRSEDDRVVLLEALRDGTADVIATDHAPHTAGDKAAGAPGFTGLETAYGVCNTVLVHDGQLSARRLSQLMSANPARILRLNKGLLATGYDADITIVDPEEEWTVDTRLFCSKGKATPFEGRRLTGKVKALFIAGRKVYES